ncbi:MAG: hypothetical protein Q7T00_02395 [Rugosibacter sp.]|jgi:hypothetical protein|nr:hypothetical protein [Rugosibacter sp.]
MTFQKMPDLTPPDDTAKVLADADQLIQRRRVFIASPSLHASSPMPTHVPAHFFEAESEAAVEHTIETAPIAPAAHLVADDADHDLPLLTEKVTSLAPSLADIQAAQRDAVQKELTCWLEQELPLAILKITDGIADQLLGELTRKAQEHLLPNLMMHLGDLPPDT